ncbi:MAG TPA: SPOR domain-containing protein [Burkholderiales bacterium]|nr:SPOR domain-containing protein [Burkholderiales bacterium]
MKSLMQRVLERIDAIHRRYGRNVFWLTLVAALAALLVVPLYLFEEPSPVAVRSPVFRGELRPAPKPAEPPVVKPPAEQPLVEKPAAEKLPVEKPPVKKPPAEKPAAEKPPPISADLYQVQLGAFASEERARRLVQDVAREGFAAVVMQVTLAGGRVLHRVRLQGALPKDQAEALQANLKQKMPALAPILMAAER